MAMSVQIRALYINKLRDTEVKACEVVRKIAET